MALQIGRFIALGLAGLLLGALPAWSTVFVKQTKDGWTASITGGWAKNLAYINVTDLTFHNKTLAENTAKYMNEAEALAVKNDEAGFNHAMTNLKVIVEIAKEKFKAADAAYWEVLKPIADEVRDGLKAPNILEYNTNTPNRDLNIANYEKFQKDQADYYKELETKVLEKVNKDPKAAALYKEFKNAEADYHTAFYLEFNYTKKPLFHIIRWYYEDEAKKQSGPAQQLVAPQGTPSPDKNTKNGQTSAPKTCGDITDQTTLLAMGCTSAPRSRTVAVTGTQAVPARARNEQSVDCLSDPLCARELEARERESGKRDPVIPRIPMAGAPPGGSMSTPGRY